MNKWVAVSEARFAGISSGTSSDLAKRGFGHVDGSGSKEEEEEVEEGMAVRVWGVAGEEVTIGFVNPSGLSVSISCTFQNSTGSSTGSLDIQRQEHLTLTMLSSGACYQN